MEKMDDKLLVRRDEGEQYGQRKRDWSEEAEDRRYRYATKGTENAAMIVKDP